MTRILKERKRINIILIILVVFIVFRGTGWVVDGVLKQKHELSSKILTRSELQNTLNEYDSLESLKLNYEKQIINLTDNFYLQGENAANIIAYGEANEVYIKAVTPLEELNNNSYYEIPFQIDFNCNYNAFKNFIRKLESYPASTIHSINLKKDEDTSNLSGNLIWKLYSLENSRNVIQSTNLEVSLGKDDPFQIPEYYVNFFVNRNVEEIEEASNEETDIEHVQNNYDITEDKYLDSHSYSFPLKN